jgi:uncharacterized protein YbjT (DUF2867 family)
MSSGESLENCGLILVAGATGDLGGAVARALLSQGKNVRVLVRPKSNYQPLAQLGAELAFGDLKDRLSLNPACRGVETLITTANSAKRGGEDNVISVDLEGNRKLIDAAVEAGVKHFIFVSVLMADPNNPVPFLMAKGKTEEYLRLSGMPYTIIAPDGFMEVWIAMLVGIPAVSGLSVTIVGQGLRRHSWISDGDVAKFMIGSISNVEAKNQRLVIGGPEPLTLLDVVAAFERALGNGPVLVTHVAPGQPIPGLPDFMSEMAAGLEFFDSAIDMTELSRKFGVRLTTIDEFARDFVKTMTRK